MVGLPTKTIETCLVELSAVEREHYDHMESEAQNTVREYIDADSVLRNYSTVLHIILLLRQICNNMALCPSDIKSFLPSDTLEGNIFSLIFNLMFLKRLLIFYIRHLLEPCRSFYRQYLVMDIYVKAFDFFDYNCDDDTIFKELLK